MLEKVALHRFCSLWEFLNRNKNLRGSTMVNTAVTVQDIIPIILNKPNAKKVDSDTIIPYVLLPALLLTATLSFIITCIVMVAIVMAALYVYSRPRQKNRSPFFYSWTKSSIIYLFIIFEIEIRGLLLITATEHVVFLILLACSLYFFYKMKSVADFELATGSTKGKEYSLVITGDCHYCPICQLEVKNRFFHSIWWDCCVLQPNYIYFLCGMLGAFATILYGVNLGLTSICHSFLFMGNFLVPIDCNDAYFDFHLALGFVGCVYGVGYLGIIALLLIKQIFSNIPQYADIRFRRLKTVLTA